MSGHNKWSKVKRIKGPIDAKRGKLFTKIIREITMAAKLGGGDSDMNPRLRQALVTARLASMPRDNIDRAIRRGTGEEEGAAMEEATYEGYGPGGVAILVETTSDNKNRTVADLRNIFKTAGGNMGEAGSVAWMFSRYGQLVFEKQKFDEDKVTEVALDAGAEDVTAHDDVVEVLTGVSDVYNVLQTFEKVGMHPQSQGFSYVPKTTVPVEGAEPAKKLLDLLAEIEEHDDVQRVHANFEMEDKLFAEVSV